MSNEPQPPAPGDGEVEESELCPSCVAPNPPSAHFCVKCGAPLTSYAATGPFESLFAEGHVYRQATERPQRFIVVFGMWVIFGMLGLGGLVLLLPIRDGGAGWETVIGGLFFILSVAILWKTSRSYLARKRPSERKDA